MGNGSVPKGKKESSHLLGRAPGPCPRSLPRRAAPPQPRPPCCPRPPRGRAPYQPPTRLLRRWWWWWCWWWQWLVASSILSEAAAGSLVPIRTNVRRSGASIRTASAWLPRGQMSRMPPAVPRDGDECSGQAPGANSPPALHQNGGCALPLRGSFPRAGHAPAPAPSRTREAQPPEWRSGPALPHPPILLCPEEGERERNTRPASSSRDQSVSTTRSSVPGETEPLVCARRWVSAAGAISNPRAGASRGISMRDSLPHGRRRDISSLHHL